MEAMAFAYVFAWAVITTYLAWMSVQSRRLSRRVDELERLAVPEMNQKRSSVKAA